MRLLSILLLLALSALTPVFAMTVDEPLADAVQEARAQSLFGQVRCVVCQGESIADSPADVAADMRRTIREHIKKGDNDQAVLDYLTSRYGDFILMQPPLKAATWLLWFGPALMLAAGGWAAARMFRKSQS